MSIDKSFWSEKWSAEKPPWKRDEIDPILLNFMQQSGANYFSRKEKRALVPLSGDSLAIPYLLSQGFEVTAVELLEKPLEKLLANLGIKHALQAGLNQVDENLKLYLGDIFEFEPENAFELIFDRAALVALSPELRRDCAKQLQAIMSNEAFYVLETYSGLRHDNESAMRPPFLVEKSEVANLFQPLELCFQEDKEIAPDKDNQPKIPNGGSTNIAHEEGPKYSNRHWWYFKKEGTPEDYFFDYSNS